MLTDLTIILFVGAVLYRTAHSGFIRQLCGTIGFIAGLFIGRAIEPSLLGHVHTINSRAFVAVIAILGPALLLLSLGEFIGLIAKHRILHHKVNRLDNIFGSFLTTLVLLAGVWVMAAVGNQVPNLGLQKVVASSEIMRFVTSLLPPAPTVISDVGRLVDPNGFPDVFIGNEPIPRNSVDLPALGSLANAVAVSRDSVLRIEGQGCGGVVSGSGFIIDNGLVATNAHVVAGIKQPYVKGPDISLRSSVVAFDPKLDFAILRVPGLDGVPLELDSEKTADGTAAAVLGYPGGGNFDAKPAVVTRQLEASGHNIYGQGKTVRSIYEVKADIVSGNSGGPLIDQDGSVLGVVFAESTSYKQVGYALTAKSILKQLEKARQQQTPITPGHCAK